MADRPTYRQNVPTTLACPKCGGTLLIMTRKADGKRFLACGSFYDERVRCDYTSNDVPEFVKMKESGSEPLPGFEV